MGAVIGTKGLRLDEIGLDSPTLMRDSKNTDQQLVAFVVQLCASVHSHVNLYLKILFKKIYIFC